MNNTLIGLQKATYEQILDLSNDVAEQLRFLPHLEHRSISSFCWIADTSKVIQTTIDGHKYYEDIHRISYLLNQGVMGIGNEIVNTCRNPECIRPSHLHQVEQYPKRFKKEHYEQHASWCKNPKHFVQLSTTSEHVPSIWFDFQDQPYSYMKEDAKSIVREYLFTNAGFRPVEDITAQTGRALMLERKRLIDAGRYSDLKTYEEYKDLGQKQYAEYIEKAHGGHYKSQYS